MRKLILSILLVYCSIYLIGQDDDILIKGKVSYITSQSVYVKFNSTEGISVGDTLFIKHENNLFPALRVKNMSSISCVCTPILTNKLSVSDPVVFKQKPVILPEEAEIKVVPTAVVVTPDTNSPEKTEDLSIEKELQQEINGRISISSYSNFSNSPSNNSQRMRYTFSLHADNIANSRLSAETYISFAHKNDKWNEIKENIFNGLKIYNLALKYDFNENTRILFGRKINSKISNIGAVDGLQFEKKFKRIYIGAIAGSRPDYTDYSYSFKLFQFGGYAGHEYQSKIGNMQSTLAFVQQMNNWNVDRRFLYFQHSNTLLKNLFFFGTVEFELYKALIDQNDSSKIDKQNTFNLSNLYFSVRYRVIRQLSFTLSYSNRQNVIYYETYKTFIERLIDSEALQGFRFRVNYRPIKYMSVGVTTGYRYRKSDPKPTMNLYAYLTYSRIPALNISATVSATFIQTSYLSGKIYSVGISRDLVPGKLYAGLAYRYINYDYSTSDMKSLQNIAEVNMSWNIYKKLSFSVYYEGTFDNQFTYNRIYANLSQRF